MNFGEKRKFKPQLDFAFGDWHIYPELGVRLGRVRFPMGLHNEYRDVDFARSSIFLNQGIYPEEFRPFVNAFDGISFYGDLGSQDHDWLNLSYQLSAGTMSVPSSFYYNDTIQNTLNSKHSHLDTDYIWSFQFKWESPIDGLELGYNYSSLNMNIDVSSDSVLDSGAAVSVDEALDFEVHVSILSLLYQLERWTFQAEKMIFQIDMSSTSRYRDALSSINPALAIGQDTLNGRFSRDLEAWSLMLEYETDDFGLPFLMLSDYTNDRNSNGDYWTHRKDITLGIRYDINSHWVLKAEHHWMEGTAMMDSLGQSTSQLEKHWTFFALRMGLNF
jgi:hypothetical protein